MKTNRQKYNFLIAFCRQLEEAADEGDEEYAEFRRIAESLFPTGGADEEELTGRIAKLEQWNAQLETALDSLEQIVSTLDGEDADEPDDSDEDAGMERDGPEMDRVDARQRGPAPSMGNAGDKEMTPTVLRQVKRTRG